MKSKSDNNKYYLTVFIKGPGFVSLFLFIFLVNLSAQVNSFSSNRHPRKIHYTPNGKDFLTINGPRRFNRALYGGNTAFRAEAGDLPEFALYLPGMGGNLKFGLIKNDTSKWIIRADYIEARYHAGSMLYTIKDGLLENGSLHITALALYDREGFIVKMEANNIPAGTRLLAVFGGATGARFSRDGDIGADPESSFYLKPEYCRDNIYRINQNTFSLFFGSRKPLTEEERYEIQHLPVKQNDSAAALPLKTVTGIFPGGLNPGDAAMQESPLKFLLSSQSATPAVSSQIDIGSQPVFYFLLLNGKNEDHVSYEGLPALFDNAEQSRAQIAGRIVVETPDPYINTLGGALAIAADAIWEEPSYLHGAVAWRMRLNGWRGAYAGDVLGWHDRARMHFDSYALSQLVSPLSAPVVMDTALHLARGLEKLGTSLFSSGYICRNPNGDFRPHHYDMNLVFIDQLLNHFLWTGDTSYVKKMWPLLTRHLDWEKRNFDTDGDGLYDAYAAIWASDALQYSGGGVAHSSAYNYRANKLAADLAKMIGEDPAPYEQEASKILKSMNSRLWLGSKGWYAEYRDLLGKKLVHPTAALWTVYHTIDSRVPDKFQSYQLLKYVDTEIPHISTGSIQLSDRQYHVLSTSNWQPYTWSLNNVVLAEILHTSLAYWQAGRNEEAYTLWKAALVESMYQGTSPGNIQQLSYFDAIRGELYRDFADDIGMTARSLVEGLFGIYIDRLHDTLYINPGFPKEWDHASIVTPDIHYSFTRGKNTDVYRITTAYGRLNGLFRIKARLDDVQSVTVNGKPVKWLFEEDAIEQPMVRIPVPAGNDYTVEINWKGRAIEMPLINSAYQKGESILIKSAGAQFLKLHDPQKVLGNAVLHAQQVQGIVLADNGNKTFFIKARQGNAVYWIPVSFKIIKPVSVEYSMPGASRDTGSILLLHANTNKHIALTGKLFLNNHYLQTVSLYPSTLKVSASGRLVPGSNRVRFEWNKNNFTEELIDWDVSAIPGTQYEKINLSAYFNDKVNNIFKNQYLSPRPASTTLQLPIQGIGNWAYPMVNPVISDSGLKRRAALANEFTIQQGVPFAFDAADKNNIVFTSQWDNFPDSVVIPLNGRSSHAYLLMAGTTNPMQSRMVNGEVMIVYKNGTSDTLELKNPQNWWPVEQDYFIDGFAFTTDAPKPVRVYFKTGEDTREFNDFITIRGFSNRGIDGGAATVLDLPLDPSKELKSIIVKAVANDVVIGLMSLTLVR